MGGALISSAADLAGIFLVGDVLHPGDGTSVKGFMHRDVGHGGGRRGAVPVFFSR